MQFCKDLFQERNFQFDNDFQCRLSITGILHGLQEAGYNKNRQEY